MVSHSPKTKRNSCLSYTMSPFRTKSKYCFKLKTNTLSKKKKQNINLSKICQIEIHTQDIYQHQLPAISIVKTVF